MSPTAWAIVFGVLLWALAMLAVGSLLYAHGEREEAEIRQRRTAR